MLSLSTSPFETDSLSAPEQQITPRLVITEDGRVVYASEGFEQLIHASPYALEGSKMQDLIIFCDPDTALRDSPFMASMPQTSWIGLIREGVHDIRLRDRGDQVFKFNFEWMQVGDGMQYLVTYQADAPQSAAMPVMTPQDSFPSEAQELVTTRMAPITKKPIRRAFSVRDAFGRADDKSGKTDISEFLDLSDDIMIRASSDGQLEMANRAFFKLFGYTAGQMSVLNFLDLIAPDDRSQVRAIFLGLIHDDQGGGRATFEASAIDAAQKIHVMNWRLKRRGESVFILCDDLSAIRENEEKLKKQQQQLSEAEAIGHMGYWRWKVGDETLTWSDEIYRIFGVERDAFTPTINNVNRAIYRRDSMRMSQVFERAMIDRNSYDMEFRLTRPNGDVRYIRCEGRCEQDESGDVVALYGIMQDVTEQTQSERDLREAKDAAERAYASKSKFLANMSHELRTPLNAIIGFSEMMQRQLLGPIGTERYLEYIDGIRQSGEHLLDLISDILDMSKIEAGKYNLDLEDVNIAKITRLAISMVEGRAAEACVELGANDFGDDLRIMADRRAVLQILLNLLSNSIKFTEPGGSIRVTLMDEGENIKLQVTDTGIGIPAHMLSTITNPFEQAANHYTRSHEGSGLGLAITKELCLMHHGHLGITSEVGKGTCVTITLPKKQHIEANEAV